MTIKNLLLTMTVLGFINSTLESIAGVTYMDDFDFETRYRNLYECDPFYWHPLHLPEHCMNVFEKLIRSKLGFMGPYKIMRKRPIPYAFNEDQSQSDYIDEDESNIVEDIEAPYEKMIKLLEGDVANEPSMPNITVIPGLGVAALYRQPVSRKSGDFIKTVARAYKEYSYKYLPLFNQRTTTAEPSTTEPPTTTQPNDNQAGSDTHNYSVDVIARKKNKKKNKVQKIRKRYQLR